MRLGVRKLDPCAVRRARWAAVLAGALTLMGGASGCRRSPQIGDHVLVEWRGADYPAVIVGVDGPLKFHVHFDGYADDWDETIPATRIRARLSTAPQAGPAAAPLAKGSGRSNAAASGSAASAPPSVYHVGDRVRVEWHGSTYPATILNTLGDDRYRIHYEGYGPEWDEDIAMGRIQRKN